MIKICVLRCGYVYTDESVPDKSKSRNPYAYTGIFRGGHRVRLPVFTYLIEHPKGRILVDTGWHTAVRYNQREHLSWQINLASKAILPKGEAISEQLKAMGLKPSDIDILLLTHLDADHASGLKLVKAAKKIYAHPLEIKAANAKSLRYNSNLWRGVPILPIPLLYYDGFPNRRAFDVFGDKKVWFVDLSGHSEGNTGVLVENDGKFVIITGDACYGRQNREERKLPGIISNKERAEKSVKWVSKMAKSESCVEILASHDPEIQPHIIEL